MVVRIQEGGVFIVPKKGNVQRRAPDFMVQSTTLSSDRACTRLLAQTIEGASSAAARRNMNPCQCLDIFKSIAAEDQHPVAVIALQLIGV